MNLRTYVDDDLELLIDLTVATFGPFYEGWVREHFGERLFAHQHGSWRDDYREQVPTLHAPDEGRHVTVAEVDGEIVGYVGLSADVTRRHGEITMLAVATDRRAQGVGTALCRHAFVKLKADGIEVVGLGTGGDPWHAPARSFYEGLGMTGVPIQGYLLAL